MPFALCYEYAEYTSGNYPDRIWKDGPEYLAAEEMQNWSD